jgi:hypothetical protein
MPPEKLPCRESQVSSTLPKLASCRRPCCYLQPSHALDLPATHPSQKSHSERSEESPHFAFAFALPFWLSFRSAAEESAFASICLLLCIFTLHLRVAFAGPSIARLPLLLGKAQRLDGRAAAYHPPGRGVKPEGRNDRILAVVLPLHFFFAFFAQKSHVKPQKHLNLYQ